MKMCDFQPHALKIMLVFRVIQFFLLQNIDAVIGYMPRYILHNAVN